MEHLGVLFTLPVESIAIRAILAAALSVLAVRLLLRIGLRTPSVRVATALVPALALLAVVVLTATSLRLPSVMLPATSPDALPVPTRGGYLHFAPMALPLLVGTWAAIAGVLLTRRYSATWRARSAALAALRSGSRCRELEAVVRRLASALAVPVPRVAVVERAKGGAYVVGTRRPVIVVGQDLLVQLDDEELEGVLAHELAHVKRRDNLVAVGLGTLRDLAFFVPGGGWAVRQLHRERELAADQVAIGVTHRPGALAGGLLKALQSGRTSASPCAAFAPSTDLVDRVRVLVDDATPISRTRRGSESLAVVAVVAGAAAAALIVPALVAGPQGERDALALLWTASSPVGADEPVTVGEARAFDVYRRSNLDVGQPSVVIHAGQDEHGLENRRSTLRACAADGAGCPVPERQVGLGIQPQPRINVDVALTEQWKAVPFTGEAGDGIGVYWLARVE